MAEGPLNEDSTALRHYLEGKRHLPTPKKNQTDKTLKIRYIVGSTVRQ